MTRAGGPRAGPLSVSEQDWLAVRSYLRGHRHRLGLHAAATRLEVMRVPGAPLLTVSHWLPARPVPLDRITLALDLEARFGGLTGRESSSEGVRPVRLDGSRYPTYSAAVSALVAPAVFEDRTTYRLLDANLGVAQPWLRFGRGTYFDGIDIGEAAGHEFARAQMSSHGTNALRTALGSPVDPALRPTNLAITAMTIRHDRENGRGSFLLHWRDPAQVGHAGGLYQVLPVGIFQPATEDPASFADDFSLWRSLVREYAEELLGEPEPDAAGPPIDYGAWPFAVSMADQLQRGKIRAYCLGMGVDPLTLATDLLVAVVIDSDVFDEVFEQLVASNAEGKLIGSGRGVPFIESEIERWVRHEPMQAAGAAALALAWEHREGLLD